LTGGSPSRSSRAGSTYVDDLEVAREVAAVAAKVPGARWVGVGLSVERDTAALLDSVKRIAPEVLKPGENFSVKASRADKSFPLNSLEIQIEVGRPSPRSRGRP